MVGEATFSPIKSAQPLITRRTRPHTSAFANLWLCVILQAWENITDFIKCHLISFRGDG